MTRRAGRVANALGVVLILLPMALAACSVEPADDATPEHRVRTLLAAYDGLAPGACVLIRQHGTAVYAKCVGLAELEGERETTPETNFRLASVTKQFTATAILALIERGDLDFETTLPEIFAGFPDYGRSVTIRHLLTHTSRLLDYEDLMHPDDTTQITDAGVLAIMERQDSTYFLPGTAYRYSNTGYALLAMTVERVSRQRFAQFLEQTIFAPLQMTGTVAHEAGVSTVEHRAYGYSRDGDGWIRTDQSTTSAVLGDGGIYSSLRDLDRWIAVLEGRDTLLTPSMQASMVRRAILANGDSIDYGYGYHLDTYRGLERIRHEGSTRGFRNELQRYPSIDLTLVVLTNRNEIAEELGDRIADLMMNAGSGSEGQKSDARP
jgi:CubicO group peptidase (beta-lactamase class C family)